MNELTDLFYQVLDRQVSNAVSGMASQLGYGAFSSIASNIAVKKVREVVSPYVSAFSENGEVDVDTLGEFAKVKSSEVIASEVEAFKQKMKGV